jgi:hypothetical protein
MHEILNERYKWDQEKIDTLKQMYDAGESNNEIANYFGLSIGSIEQALLRFYSDRKKRNHIWNEEDIKTLKQLLDGGMSVPKIANHFGLSTGSIEQALKKYYSDRKKRKQKSWTEEDIKNLKQLYDEDMSVSKIANHFDVGTSSIEQALERYYSNRKKRNHIWTDEYIEILKQMYDAGIDLIDIGTHFGLSKSSIQKALERYYSDRKKQNLTWTDERVETLKQMYDAGISLIDIGTHFGLSKSSITHALKTYYSDRKKRDHKWTEEDIKTLKRLHDEGIDLIDIGTHFGLSKSSIATALHNYYFDRKKIEKIPWNKTQIKELGDLLDQGNGPSEIAKRLERNISSVEKALDKYYHDRKKRQKRLWNEEEILEIRELYKKGYGPTYIGNKFNEDSNSVFYLIKKQKDYETALLPPHLENLQQLHGTSHIEIDFFNALKTELETRFHNRNIKIKRNHNIPREGKRPYNVDGIEQTQKLAIEFFGTLWHADPVVYPNPDQYLTKLSCTAGEVRDYDGKKIAWLAKTLGKSPVIIWEREWNNKSTKQECIDRVLSALGLI